jgi:hypothetical protein
MVSKKQVGASAITILAIVAVGLGLLQVSVGTATADGAVVIKNDGLCGMPGSDASGNLIFGGIGQVTTDVTNGNKEMLKCKGSGLTNLSGQGQSFDGFFCGTFTGVTTDSHAMVSASGEGTLTCTVHF